MSVRGRDNFDSLSDEFINKFDPKQRDIIIEAFLQTDYRTHGIQSPRLFQIECAVALKTGQDLMRTAGCGTGKTLAMVLPVMLLDDKKMAITIVPLKLLQQNHVRPLTLTISVDGWYLIVYVSWKHLISMVSHRSCSMKIHHTMMRYGRYA